MTNENSGKYSETDLPCKRASRTAYDDELCKKFGYEPCINEYSLKNGHYTQEQYNENEENGKKLEAYLDEVAKRAFKAAIIVNIDLPNDVEKFEEAVK